MQAQFAGRTVIIVLLDSWGKYTLTDAVASARGWGCGGHKAGATGYGRWS
jgi:hypothetical protein